MLFAAKIKAGAALQLSSKGVLVLRSLTLSVPAGDGEKGATSGAGSGAVCVRLAGVGGTDGRRQLTCQKHEQVACLTLAAPNYSCELTLPSKVSLQLNKSAPAGSVVTAWLEEEFPEDHPVADSDSDSESGSDRSTSDGDGHDGRNGHMKASNVIFMEESSDSQQDSEDEEGAGEGGNGDEEGERIRVLHYAADTDSNSDSSSDSSSSELMAFGEDSDIEDSENGGHDGMGAELDSSMDSDLNSDSDSDSTSDEEGTGSGNGVVIEELETCELEVNTGKAIDDKTGAKAAIMNKEDLKGGESAKRERVEEGEGEKTQRPKKQRKRDKAGADTAQSSKPESAQQSASTTSPKKEVQQAPKDRQTATQHEASKQQASKLQQNVKEQKVKEQDVKKQNVKEQPTDVKPAVQTQAQSQAQSQAKVLTAAKEGKVNEQKAKKETSPEASSAASCPQVGVKKNLGGGLMVEVVKPGQGKQVASHGKHVTVGYHGTLTNGKKFDSGTFGFRVGAGEVVPGFDRSVVGMRVGETRRVLIPARLGYGSQRMGSIPPNSNLVFQITLNKVK